MGNEIIYICNYIEDILTYNSSDLAINSFNGYTYTIRQSLQYKMVSKKKILQSEYTIELQNRKK